MSQRNVAQYTSKTYAEHKAYWAKQVSLFPEPFVFRQHEEFPAAQATRNTLRFVLPTDNVHAQEYQNLAAASQLVVGLSVLFRVLHYYSGSINPVVEVPGMQPGQMVPIGTEITPTRTLRDGLQATQQYLKDAFTFADYPRQLAQADKLGSNVLVVAFPLHSAYQAGNEAHDLVLTVDTSADMVVLLANYHTGAYDESFVQRLLAQWGHAFSWLATKESPVTELPLWDSATQDTILQLSRGKVVNYPSGTLHQMFSQRANQHPNQIALHSAGLELTYEQVEAQSNALAAYLLSEYKLAVGSTVGIMLHRSHLWPIAMLGVLKAGGAYLPIEPSFPESRRNHMLQDSQVAVLLTEMEFLFTVHDQNFPVMALDLQLDQLPPAEAAPTTEAGPESPAYVIYTSGTSGKPKGITIPHRGLAHYQHWFADTYLPEGPNTTLLFNSVAFDLGYTTYWASLLWGSKLVILPDPGYFDAEAFAQAIVDHQVTYLKLTPTHFRLAYSHLMQQPSLAHLQLVVLGGEAMHYDLLAQFQQKHPHVQLVNHYGPTETTIGCLTQPMGTVTGQEKQVIGTAISNSYAYILNEALEPFPPGVPGELCLSGPGVALGYQNLPELNQERFLTDLPFHSGPYAVYRTGDKAVMNELGQVEFLGRIDQQISLNGYRIEPEEIEKVLKTQEGVQDVYIRKHRLHGTESLVAYFTASESVSSEVCTEICKQSLPDFMVPQYYVQMDELPVSANGKIDINRLPLPETGQNTGDLEADVTEVEGLLLNIWAQVLGRKVALHADFFENGGDSIKAVQVAAMGYEAGYRLDVKHLFENPTVHQLAQVIQPLSRQSDQGQAEGHIPLTPIQRQLFAETPNPAHFNQALAIQLPDGCTPDQVQAALDTLVKHHDTLRLTYPTKDGVIQQQYTDLPLSLEEHTFESPAAFTEHAQAQQRSFNLETGPLVKATYCIQKQHTALLLVIHHLVIDGVSWRIILEDLDRLLVKKTALPPKTDSYQYWQQWLAQYFDNQDYTETKYFWQEQSESLPNKPFSTVMGEMKGLHLSLPAADTQKALTIAEQGLDINSLLVAALYTSYQAEMGKQTLQILLEGHGRDLPLADVNISRTLGWFTVHYPITLHPTEGGNDQQLIKHIHNALKKVDNHKAGYLQERYPDTQASTLPHPQLKFNYLGQLQEGGAEGLHVLDWNVGDTQAPDTPVHHPYLVSGIVKQGQLHLTLTYHPSAADADKVATWWNTLEQTLLSWLKQETLLNQPIKDFTYTELSDKDLDSLFA